MEYPFKDLLPLDEVLEREGYYKDWTHLDPKVFYSLTQISEYIKTKGFGVDVRLLIAQLAEHFSLKTAQINQIELFFNDVMQELAEDKEFYSLPEIAGARRGYSTLVESLQNLSVNMLNTNLGKLTQIHMSDELLAQIAGDTAVNAVPADGSITTDKLADNAVTPDQMANAKLITENLMLGKVYENFGGLGFKTNRDLIPVEPNIKYKHNFYNFSTFGSQGNYIEELGNEAVKSGSVTFDSNVRFVKGIARDSISDNDLYLRVSSYELDDEYSFNKGMVMVTCTSDIIFDFDNNTMTIPVTTKGTTVAWDKGSTVISGAVLDFTPLTTLGVFVIYFNIADSTFYALRRTEAKDLSSFYVLFATVYPQDRKVTANADFKILGLNDDTVYNPDNNRAVGVVEKHRNISGTEEWYQEVNTAKYPSYPVWGHEYLYEWYDAIKNNLDLTMVWAGDSTTKGAGDVSVGYHRHELGKKIMTLGGYDSTKVTSLNAGHEGRHTGNWLSNTYPITENPAYDSVPEFGYLHEDMQLNPKLYIIGYGINDGGATHWPGLSWQQRLDGFEARMEEGLRRIRTTDTLPSGPSYGKTHEEMNIILTMPNSTNNTENFNNFIRPILQKLCRKYQCAFVDFTTRQYDHTYSKNWTSGADNVHPNSVANADYMSMMADLLYPYLLHKS